MRANFLRKTADFIAAFLPDFSTAGRLLLTSSDELVARIESSQEFIDAEEFKRSIDPSAATDYAWVTQHAKYAFDRTDKIFKELDEKANDIIKYLGGGAGLITFAALAGGTPKSAWLLISSIPAFMLAIISLALAARARQPGVTWQPPGVAAAFSYASHQSTQDHSEVRFLGQWEIVCAGMLLVLREKGVLVRCATDFYVCALGALIIPIIVAAISLLLSASPAP
jgi:hypothetical protein